MAILILIVVLFIIYGIIIYLGRSRTRDATPPPGLMPTPAWGPETPSSDPEKGQQCLLYTFPASLLTYEDTRVPVPGTGTLSTTVLNQASGVSNFPSCYDTDQIMAQQVMHTCLRSSCYRQDGTLAASGETETYYATSSCGISACSGYLALVGVNFIRPNHAQCVISPQTPAFLATLTRDNSCDITQTSEVFRITRANPGQTSSPGKTGLLAQILDRNLGLCLVPDSQLNLVFLDVCTPNGGYIWALIPSFYDTIHQTSTPQQIAYVGNVDVSTMPEITSGDTSGLVTWLTDNQIRSLINNFNTLTLVPFNFDSTSELGQQQTTQIIPYNQFNALKNTPVCVATSGTTCTF